MSKIYRTILWFVLGLLVASCGAPVTPLSPTTFPTPLTTLELMPTLSIARHPEPAIFSGLNVFIEPPVYDSKSSELRQINLRAADLTQLDLSKSTSDLLFADFDSKTQWPAAEKMPADFDWQEIMEIGKDPGLGVRSLHDQGITGNRIGISIIDHTLLVDHIEYKDRIRVYEEVEDVLGTDARTHGAAVASIAVGRTVGIAPEADLYYVATGECGGLTTLEEFDYTCYVKAVQRIIEINKNLPADRKIRVLSMSFGWYWKNKGYDRIMSAVNEAKAAGIFVISANIGQTHKLYFQGLGRHPLNDPNQVYSYAPGLWWQKDFFSGKPLTSFPWYPPGPMLLVPMDSRTTASPTGTEDYVFYRQGGWSWSIPYLAGMYALAAQVKPEITPEEFWETALNTGKTIQIQHDGKEYELGVILDPQALIKAIKAR